MLHGERIGAVLLIGGEGTRMGGEIPKQFLRLSGKKVYLHTLEVFWKARFFDEIVLVCHPDWIERVREETISYGVRVVAGGTTRQASSWAGLRGLVERPKVVVIHDGVRPFVSEEILRANVRGALEHGAVDTCTPSADTLVYAPGGERIETIPRRADFLRGQTPQSFLFDWIWEAHEEALAQGREATDDCRLVLEMGRPVGVVSGDEMNVKITTELDLFLAEQIFRLRVAAVGEKRERNLRGKVYAVVGGNGGIGRAICERLREGGAETIVLSRAGEERLDLGKTEEIGKTFERLFHRVGPLDGLINCAGKLVVKPLDKMDLSEIEEVLSVNLQGLIVACREARLKEGAHVINFASSSFSRGRKESGVYSCSKAAVVNFSQALAEERPELRVWAVAPQRTRTAMRMAQFPGEEWDSLLDPMEIAEQVLDLLSDSVSTGLIAEIRKR